MVALALSVTPREAREIEALARLEGGKIGRIDLVSIDEMARALLLAHLILIRDCGDVLPGTGVKLKPCSPAVPAAKFKSSRGVSLSVSGDPTKSKKKESDLG